MKYNDNASLVSIKSSDIYMRFVSFINEYKFIIIIVIIGIILTFIPVIVYILNFSSVLSKEHSRFAEFGDYLGGILSPIFSFLSLVGLLLTLHYQNKSNAKQSFENHFFNFLTFHYKILDGISIENGSEKKKGKECFEYFQKLILLDHIDCENNRAKRYDEFYSRFNNQVGHYFRNLYRIYLFIEKSDINDEDKKQYTGILRAQLSFNELIVLFYNGLSKEGEKFKPLIQTYAMFENFPDDIYDQLDVDLGDYDEKVYGDNSNKILEKYFLFKNDLNDFH